MGDQPHQKHHTTLLVSAPPRGRAGPAMAALAAPVRIEGFGAPSIAEAAPVLRRNPASLPNVLEAANALEVRSIHPTYPSL